MREQEKYQQLEEKYILRQKSGKTDYVTPLSDG